MKPQSALGTRPRVTIRRVVRVQYRLEWEYDGSEHAWDEETGSHWRDPVRRVRSRYVLSAATAYRMAAMRLIFARRDKFATGTDEKGHPVGCTICEAKRPRHPEDDALCRYHGGEGFEVLRKRLARWLRWRDSVTQ